ncbi:hypothetical protein BDQ17DRAFT_1431898 [Cyathus striatus]|nr:hypothetical protein BDQ17DRAFT_1431898 [Cyathus striatus]
MRQSLQASKAAQSMKRAQEMLERERNVEVLRRSGTSIAPPPPPPRNRSQSPSKFSSVSSSAVSSASASSGTGARARASTWERQNEISSAGAPPLPRRPGPSPPLSESSLMQGFVAFAFQSGEFGFAEAPKHPDREKKALGSNVDPASTTTFYSSLQSATPTADQSTFSAQDSPTARVFRSRSMHVPGSNESSPREVITPPPRRRRPESVQVLPGSSSGGLARHVSLQQHHRRSSSTDVNTPTTLA